GTIRVLVLECSCVGARNREPTGVERRRAASPTAARPSCIAGVEQANTAPPSRITKSRRSFDHLVGAGEQRRWHGEAELFGSFEIDRQLVVGRVLHRKVGRLLALEDAINVTGGALL